MVFEVTPEQIEKLNSEDLVELLRKLLHTEAQYSGIKLRGVSVPPQITVADGGEDGRIWWNEGCDCTDYLPSRFCIFQSKASELAEAGWKKEMWKKGTQGKGKTRELSDAIQIALDQGASYIGFTSAVIIGDSKYKSRIKGIKTGIEEARGNPEKLNTIDIYDANKITEWVNKYPAIAIWLNEKQSGLNLKGFQTVENLEKRNNISETSYFEGNGNHFQIFRDSSSQSSDGINGDNSVSFVKAKENIVDFLTDSGKFVRITGASGVGKSRFVLEVLKDNLSLERLALEVSAIYCDLRDISQTEIFQVVRSLLDNHKAALIIVDECSRDISNRLHQIIGVAESNIKLITISNDNQSVALEGCLNITINPADAELIEAIVRERLKNADYSDIEYIKTLSAGYPRIAMLATEIYSKDIPIVKSIEDTVARMLDSCGIRRPEEIRAIECLSLFKELGADGHASQELDLVAEMLARMTGDEMYEHLSNASKNHLVDSQGYLFKAQPITIAAFLGARRLDLLRTKNILDFLEKAPSQLRQSFLSQWNHFDRSQTAMRVAQTLLSRNGWCSSLEGINTDCGIQCLAALVHIDPDGVTDAIRYILGDMSVDELDSSLKQQQEIVPILKLLAFRKESFYVTAPILMRLGAISRKLYYLSDAANCFKQFYHLKLSATEAEPDEKFAVLDQGLSLDDERVISLCVEALDKVLERTHFSRWGSSYSIGSRPPLKDWQPKVWGEVFSFYRSGLERLESVRIKKPESVEKCDKIFASRIRSLLCEDLFEDIARLSRIIKKDKEIWLEGLKGVGNWLYFDQEENLAEFTVKVRSLYNELIPTDLIQKALFYTKFWSGDIRNPDLIDTGDDHDDEYSSRKAQEVAAEIAKDDALTRHAISVMIKEELNNASSFAKELTANLDNPLEIFQFAVDELEKAPDQRGMQFLNDLLSGIDSQNNEIVNECIQYARKSEIFKEEIHLFSIYLSVQMSKSRLAEITDLLKQGNISASVCGRISYGGRLNYISATDLIPFIQELSSRHGADGIWATIRIISIYYLDRKNRASNELYEQLKKILVSETLFEKTAISNRDEHSLESLLRSFRQFYRIDDNLAIGLSNQIVRFCQFEDYRASLDQERIFKIIIKLLLDENPVILWRTLSSFFEIATPQELYLLENLINVDNYYSDDVSWNGSGRLFSSAMESEYLSWAKINSTVRTPFLCLFFPILEKNEDGTYQWHPATSKMAEAFGTVKEFREALSTRLHPSSWSGSIIPYLRKYLMPLREWYGHPVQEIQSWARDTHRTLEREIERNRQQESRN